MENLWNMGKGKTRATIHFVRSLEPEQSWDTKEKQKFSAIIDATLEMTTANEMLESIGYRYNAYPTIYDKVTS